MMNGQANGNPSQETDLAQAFRDLARGEQTATALENHLTALERKIEEMLAKAEEDERATSGQSNHDIRGAGQAQE